MKAIFLTLACLVAICFSSFASEHSLAKHADLITALSEIKSNSESIKAEVKKWKDADGQKAQQLYITMKGKSDALIDRYLTIIANPKKARREGINVDNELTVMQKANNEFVQFFKDSFSKHAPSPNLNITAELVDIVFSTGKNVFDFFVGIQDKQKKQWSDQTEKQRIPAW